MTSEKNLPVPPLVPGSLACLAGKIVYLDIAIGDPGRPLIKFIRKHLRKQGAIVDDFFSRSVHYVFTDRTCCSDDTTGANGQDFSNSVPSVRNYIGQNGVIKSALTWGIGVYRLATVEAWLRRNLRMMGCLSSSAGGAASGDFALAATNTTSSIHSRPPPLLVGGAKQGQVAPGPINTSNKNGRFTSSVASNSFRSGRSGGKAVVEKPPIRLNGAFIRLDDKSGEFRPFYHEMTSWPVLRLDPVPSSTSAAGGSPFVDLVSPAQPSIQPGPRLVAMEKKNVVKPTAMRGYCEACCMAVADIDRHLQGDEHAKRIKKATTTTQHNSNSKASANKSATKSSHPNSRTGGGADDFAKPLAQLDAVIAQHFGPTPTVRMALLESYLEQAAGDFEEQNCQFVNSSVLDDNDDDDNSNSGQDDEQEEPVPTKKTRNEEKENENVAKDSEVVIAADQQPQPNAVQCQIGGGVDPNVLVSKLEKLVEQVDVAPKEMAVVSPECPQPTKPKAEAAPDFLADLLDNWGDQPKGPEPKLSVSTCAVANELDSLTIAADEVIAPTKIEQEEQPQPIARKTKRLLPTVGATVQALAQLQQESVTSSSSLFANKDSLSPPQLELSPSSSSLPFVLSPRKQIKEAENAAAKEKKPRKSTKKASQEGAPSRKSKSKKEPVPPVIQPGPPSPVIPSRAAKAQQQISLPQQQAIPAPYTVFPCQTTIGYIVQAQPDPVGPPTFQFQAAIESYYLQQQLGQQNFPFSFPNINPQLPFNFVGPPNNTAASSSNLQQSQQQPFAMMPTRRRSGNSN